MVSDWGVLKVVLFCPLTAFALFGLKYIIDMHDFSKSHVIQHCYFRILHSVIRYLHDILDLN